MSNDEQVVNNIWNQDLVYVNPDQTNNNAPNPNNNNLQAVSSTNFERETQKTKPLRGKGKKWDDLETFDSYKLFVDSQFYKDRILTKKIVKHRDRNGVQNYVCKYKKLKGYNCEVEFRVISDGGKFKVQEPADQCDHNHELQSDRKNKNYAEVDTELTDMVKNDVKSNKMMRSLKEKNLCPDDMKRKQFYAKVNRIKKKLKLDQVIFYFV